MRKRPMKGLLDALTSQGATVEFLENEGFFPLILRTSGLQGGSLSLDASASSQILSALLMVAPLHAKAPRHQLAREDRFRTFCTDDALDDGAVWLYGYRANDGNFL